MTLDQALFLMGALLGGAVVTGALTPLVARLSLRLGLVVEPDSRKLHSRAVPQVGGVAVFGGLVVGAMAYAGVYGLDSVLEDLSTRTHLSLLIPCSLVFLIGVIDDVRGLGPIPRVLGEAFAAVFLFKAGYVIDVVQNPFGDPIDLGLMTYPITLLWFVGITNAFNLIDGIDGLVGTISIAALLGCAVVALDSGRPATFAVSLALTGALVGFLPWNWHKARIFLGDSGSLLVGFTIAALSLHVARGDGGLLRIQIPVLLCALPMVETTLTLARRHVSGRPYFSADRGHIHYVLLRKGLSVPRAVVVLGLVQAMFCAVAVLIGLWPTPYTLIPVVIAIIVALIGVRWLGYIELRVIRDRIGRDMFRRPTRIDHILALASAGQEILDAREPSELTDRLGTALAHGGLLFIAVEPSELTWPLVARSPGPEACQNADSLAYLARRNGQVGWLCDQAFDVDTARLASVTYRIPLEIDTVRYGVLVCRVVHERSRQTPDMADVQRYLASPVAEQLESWARGGARSSPDPPRT